MSNTEQFVAIAQRSQQATTKAVQVWTDAVKSYADNISVEHPLPRPADVHTVVDGWFDMAGQLLAEQHNYAKTLIDAGLEAAGTAADHARSVAEQAYASAGAPKRTRAPRPATS